MAEAPDSGSGGSRFESAVRYGDVKQDRRRRWIVAVVHAVYDPRSRSGRSRQRYTSGEVDYFFIVTGNGDKYLIPLEVAGDLKSLTLDDKYALFRLD